MGRLFDTWAQADGRPDAGPEPAGGFAGHADEPAPGDDYDAGGEETVVDHPLDDEALPPDAPFIEVGGRRADVPVIVPVPPEPTPAPAVTPGIFAVDFRPLPARGAAGPFGPEVVVYHDAGHAVTGQYRSVWSGLTGQGAGGASRVLLFAGAAAGSGTTTVALNVALTAAREDGLRVVVVDANAARPAVAARLGVPDEPGLGDVAARSVPLAWALRPTTEAGVFVLPAGAAAVTAAVAAVLADLRKRFDLVVVDGPEAATAAGLATLVDSAYLVVRRADLDAAGPPALDAIDPAGGRVRGCVLTGD